MKISIIKLGLFDDCVVIFAFAQIIRLKSHDSELQFSLLRVVVDARSNQVLILVSLVCIHTDCSWLLLVVGEIWWVSGLNHSKFRHCLHLFYLLASLILWCWRSSNINVMGALVLKGYNKKYNKASNLNYYKCTGGILSSLTPKF